MTNATTHIKRAIAAAGLVAAIAAPTASAREADPVIAPSTPATHAPTMADIAAHHEEIGANAWQTAHTAEVPAPATSDDGLDLTAVGIGAGLVFVVVLAEAGGRTILRRRNSGVRLS